MKRNFRVLISVNADEKQQIRSNADAMGYSISGYLRQLGCARCYLPGTDAVLPQIIIRQKHIKRKNKKRSMKNEI